MYVQESIWCEFKLLRWSSRVLCNGEVMDVECIKHNPKKKYHYVHFCVILHSNVLLVDGTEHDPKRDIAILYLKNWTLIKTSNWKCCQKVSLLPLDDSSRVLSLCCLGNAHVKHFLCNAHAGPAVLQCTHYMSSTSNYKINFRPRLFSGISYIMFQYFKPESS